MRLAPEASAKSGCSGSRNSPPPSSGMRPRSQIRQNRKVYDRIWQSPLKRGIWLISEDHSRKYAARKERPGCSDTGLRMRTEGGSNTPRPSDLSGNFRRIRTHGARWTGSEFLIRINDDTPPGRIRFNFLAEHYLKADFGADAARPKSTTTIPIVEHYVRNYLIKRFGEAIAEDIKPLEIQKWLKSLNETGGLAWTTIAKIRGIMHRIYKVGILHERLAKNPVENVETRSNSTYRAIIITPAQTLIILKSLPSLLHHTLVLTCAATALRSSEILALRWADVMWGEGRIRVSKRWAKGEDGETKTDTSDGYVPLHPVLAGHLRAWQRQSPFAKATDFVFPS